QNRHYRNLTGIIGIIGIVWLSTFYRPIFLIPKSIDSILANWISVQVDFRELDGWCRITDREGIVRTPPFLLSPSFPNNLRSASQIGKQFTGSKEPGETSITTKIKQNVLLSYIPFIGTGQSMPTRAGSHQQRFRCSYHQ